MNAAKGSDHSPVFYSDMSCERHAIGEHGMVADDHVMRHMNIRHQQIVVADAGDQAASFRATVNRHELADSVAVSNARLRSLAFIFQILRRDAYCRVGVEQVVLPEARALANLDARADDAKWPDFGRFGDSRRGIYNGAGMHRHRRQSGHRNRLVRLALGQLAHYFSFRHYNAVHGGLPMHLGHRRLAFAHPHLNAKLVARAHRSAKFSLFDGSEKDQLAVPIFDLLQHKHAGYLRHRFDDKNAGHNGVIRKVSHRPRLISRDIIDADDALRLQLKDAIDEQHRIAVRKDVADRIDVQQWHAVPLL